MSPLQAVSVHFHWKIFELCIPKNQIIFIHLWAIYIFPGSVHLFCCSQIGRPNVEIGTKVAQFPQGYFFQCSVQYLCSAAPSVNNFCN